MTAALVGLAGCGDADEGGSCEAERAALRAVLAECPCAPDPSGRDSNGGTDSGSASNSNSISDTASNSDSNGDSLSDTAPVTSGADDSATAPVTSGGDGGGDSGGDDTTGGDDTAGADDCEAIARQAAALRACDCGPDGGTDTTGTTGADTEVVCDADAPVTLYLSADDSNSMSSPVQVRAAVLASTADIVHLPIRPWEFFNYYDFAYPAASEGVRVTADLVADEGADDRFTLQIGVSSPALTPADRPAMNLAFALDTSGSMEGLPIELLREVCRAVAANLRAGDIVSMVTWNTENTVVLAGHPVAGPDDPALLAAIDAVQSDGGTDLHSGLVAGYELAGQSAQPGMTSRLLLISDGGANAGVTDLDIISAAAGAENEDGIYLVGVGVGTASFYNDLLMDTVTDAGKGASVFVPDQAEAWHMFGERFVSTLLVAARDVQVRLDLPPGFEIEAFSGEAYSDDPAEVEPQHLAPADAMVFHQRLRTCAPELASKGEVTVTASYLDVLTFEPQEASVTMSFEELLAAPAPRLAKGAALLAYTDALTALRLADTDAQERVVAALAAIDAAAAVLPGDPVLVEIRAVLEQF